jgi:hypothetical protein
MDSATKDRSRSSAATALPMASPPRIWYFDIPAAAFENLPASNRFDIDFPNDEVEVGDIVVVRKYLPQSLGSFRKGVINDNWHLHFGTESDGPHRLNFGKYGPPKAGEQRCIKPDGTVEPAITSLYM